MVCPIKKGLHLIQTRVRHDQCMECKQHGIFSLSIYIENTTIHIKVIIKDKLLKSKITKRLMRYFMNFTEESFILVLLN